jgi:hypothetical protein
MVFSALVSVPFCRRSQSVEGHEQSEGAGSPPAVRPKVPVEGKDVSRDKFVRELNQTGIREVRV